MDVSYIAKRITELRLARNVSEYQMSLELGQSKSYVQSITSGKNLPSVHQLFNIADYFNMTLAEFFDEGYHDSPELQEAIHALRRLRNDDVALILSFIRRLALQDTDLTKDKAVTT